MDLSTLQNIENLSGLLLQVSQFLITIIRFMFFTPWGWGLIAFCLILIIFRYIHNHEGNITFASFVSGISSLIFIFLSHISVLLFSLILIIGIIKINDSLKLFTETLTELKELKEFEAVVKNLESERKVLEIITTRTEDEEESFLNVQVTYFAYSPIRKSDFKTFEKNYQIKGNRLYVSLGLINFKYAQIESGESINIAFPDKIYSDEISYHEGVSIMQKNQWDIPYTAELDTQDLYLIDRPAYNETVSKIYQSIQDNTLAQKYGIRTTYSEALSLYPSARRVYRIYSTSTGGLNLEYD